MKKEMEIPDSTITCGSWVKLYHRFKDWEWYTDIKTKSLFLHILLSVNHVSKNWKGVEVPRGSFVTTREKLAEETGLTEQEVRTAINRLKSTKEITNKTTKKFTIITLCNFDTYQGEKIKANQQINQQINQQLTNKQPTTNQQLTTTIEYKNNRYIVVDDMTREEFFKFFFSEGRQAEIEQICMSRKFGSIENFKKLAKAVLAEWEGEPHASRRDATQHLINHCARKQSEEEKNNRKGSSANRRPDKAPRRVNDQWAGFKVPTE